MSTNPAPPPLSAADYEAIELAVMETARGRWFLAEYARRNRHADTEMLLGALERLENVVRNETALPSADRIRGGLMEMASAIAQTKAEIAVIKSDAAHGRIEEASEELDSVVQATERATSDILAAAEQVQEIAWTLREQGHRPETCDFLDDQATDIYTACSFQDVTGQRIRKVIGVLGYLESRIDAMIEIWGFEPSAAVAAPAPSPSREGEAALLNGPAKPGQGLDQADIDVVMGAAEVARPAPTVHAPSGDRTDRAAWNADEPVVAGPLAPHGTVAEYDAEIAHVPVWHRADPLAPFRVMSHEERIALFS